MLIVSLVFPDIHNKSKDEEGEWRHLLNYWAECGKNSFCRQEANMFFLFS